MVLRREYASEDFIRVVFSMLSRFIEFYWSWKGNNVDGTYFTKGPSYKFSCVCKIYS